MLVQKDVELSLHTTLEIGGKAKYFVTVKDTKDLKKSLIFAKSNDLPPFIISGGSNTIFSDDGYNGIIIKMKTEGIKIIRDNKKSIIIQVSAGTNWDTFVKYCVEKGYQGIECPSGIPGSVGATPIQNVGAYGQEVAQTIQSVECIDKDSFKKNILNNQECKFSYRDSIFKKASHLIIIFVVFKLKKSQHAKTFYPQLSQRLLSDNPALKEIRSIVIKLRKEKSMILSSKDINTKSVGSFFKNPIIPKRKFSSLEKEVVHIPHWKVGSSYKISAAWLIEAAGFAKGYNFNEKIGLSTKHSLAIVNKKQARSTDLVEFAKLIQQKVYEKFSISLIPEPVLVGIEL